MTCVAFQVGRFCKRRSFVREVKRDMCLKDMGSKIDVFFEYGEWENEYKNSSSVVVCLAMLGFSIGGWIKAKE